jgi:hypothetical protein
MSKSSHFSENKSIAHKNVFKITFTVNLKTLSLSQVISLQSILIVLFMELCSKQSLLQ